ncbi:hypothetical protein LPJ77_000682 [Coemansia sp. RSA 2523]|nr:hypothetical protein LPJ54_000315 [Coemansia sp. RSA 1824]KAJ1810727.1 hypothetical protein LPJ77_000682 [Coemansia sp. RSA 2523]KAJ2118858.1 hypothetical protein GGF48_004430 [Coemansia sp. RSA 921]KAJ2139099.1 hypothetical protein GGH17_000736 [Coemansia sp. RSA 788]KAJ2147821.1 hypothetical protein IW142_001382 [Coemansia sp. RSA 564]KAJ2167913.1 hypothetical protein GGH15_001790 [Coemansia sp. RSA 562]KAJ2175948.1 hypothetical protein GGH16_000428 [Coemansia sp. RSA 560]KAJ2190472.1 h
MRGLDTLAVILLLSISALGDSDYDSFMSSLSFNWQNEFSDLRYQVDQLQKTDPQKYNELAASLGLKPGTKVSIPSQYSPVWASKFVQAAGLYTPPATTAEDPTHVPTPTNSSLQSIDDLTQLITVTADDSTKSDDSDGSDEEDESDATEGSDGSQGSHSAESDDNHSNGKKSNDGNSSDDTGGASGLDTPDEENTSLQFGNPIVGGFSGGNTPIVPTGQGYSAATSTRPLAMHILGTAAFSMWLTLLSL